ncbi:MAG: NAD(P)H-hydrate epimerase, partial [Lachnospiraceae bacterium]|nr:NAD(P)H-hydrate epimerase [Lachnospiraceae bacterium]
MKYVLSPERIREAEKTTIEEIGISEEALIEKAAGEIVKCIGDFYPSAVKILVVAGGGNNGADGLSAARMLIYKGYLVDVLLHFSKQSPANLFLLNGLRAAGRLSKGKVTFVDAISKEYDLIIDSLFGIGLNRELSKDDIDFIKRINSLNIPIISADIPSGLNASTGLPMPVCINSDTTICFGAYKTGMFNGQGPNYYKRLLQGDIELWYEEKASDSKMLEKEDIFNIFSDSIATAHKGTYGKALIIAGSKEIYGAAYLCAKAAFYSGAGMVKVITHACNRSDFLQ